MLTTFSSFFLRHRQIPQDLEAGPKDRVQTMLHKGQSDRTALRQVLDEVAGCKDTTRVRTQSSSPSAPKYPVELENLYAVARKFPSELAREARDWIGKRGPHQPIPREIAFFLKQYEEGSSDFTATGIRAMLSLVDSKDRQLASNQLVNRLADQIRAVPPEERDDGLPGAARTLLQLCESTDEMLCLQARRKVNDLLTRQDNWSNDGLRRYMIEWAGKLVDPLTSFAKQNTYDRDSSYVGAVAKLAPSGNKLPEISRIRQRDTHSQESSGKRIRISGPGVGNSPVVNTSSSGQRTAPVEQKTVQKPTIPDGHEISDLARRAFDPDESVRNEATRSLVQMYTRHFGKIGRQLSLEFAKTRQEPHPILATMVVIDQLQHRDNDDVRRSARKIATEWAQKRGVYSQGAPIYSLHRLLENNEINTLRSNDYSGKVFFGGARSSHKFDMEDLQKKLNEFSKHRCPYYVESIHTGSHYVTLLVSRNPDNNKLRYTLFDSFAKHMDREGKLHTDKGTREFMNKLDRFKDGNEAPLFEQTSSVDPVSGSDNLVLTRLQNQSFLDPYVEQKRFPQPLEGREHMANSCGTFGIMLAEAILSDVVGAPDNGGDPKKIVKDYVKMFGLFTDETRAIMNLSTRMMLMYRMFDTPTEYDSLLTN